MDSGLVLDVNLAREKTQSVPYNILLPFSHSPEDILAKVKHTMAATMHQLLTAPRGQIRSLHATCARAARNKSSSSRAKFAPNAKF